MRIAAFASILAFGAVGSSAHDHGKGAVQDTLKLGEESVEDLERKWGFEVGLVSYSPPPPSFGVAVRVY